MKVLEQIPEQVSDRLIVGGGPDDSGVYKVDEHQYMVQSVDFFPPIVDDPADYGAIAAANSVSDVYAMGAEPATALNVVGFPYDEVGEDRLNEILRGEAEKVRETGGLIVGGHTVKNPEPVVGLAVTGFVFRDRLVQNAACRPGDRLFLTKPLGTGIVTTAFQGDGLLDGELAKATSTMKRLNDIGIELANRELVNSMTDITGYGLIGHAQEMIGPGLGAEVSLSTLPVLTGVRELVEDDFVPGGTKSNWAAFGDWVTLDVDGEFGRWIVSDAQTSGGLLLSVPEPSVPAVKSLLEEEELYSSIIGEITEDDGFHLIP